jgi:hypothetical protein
LGCSVFDVHHIQRAATGVAGEENRFASHNPCERISAMRRFGELSMNALSFW